ncbi:MAG: hypothetical protein SNH27_10705 [Rikenellaceae bacterium]
MEDKKVHSFVKHHIHLRYLFDPAEMSFVIQLLHLDYLRQSGYRTAYSREFMYDYFQLKERTFNRCLRRLSQLGLIERVKDGLYVDYRLNREVYNRLLDILHVTNNFAIISNFCKEQFEMRGRTVESITDEEVEQLRLRGSEARPLSIY